MAFSEKQIAALRDTLDPKHVKAPPKGKYGSYVEGWHVISEANRIFGFDGWTSETDLTFISEREVNGKFRVDYRARVTITVMCDGQIVKRDGCGFGQGIDNDLGQAHESALKEAETDARKRALMTFGNPFGLALYDKTKANVAPPSEGQIVPDASVGPLDAGGMSNKDIKEAQARLSRMIDNCNTEDDLSGWIEVTEEELATLPEDVVNDLRGRWKRRRTEIRAKVAA